MNYLYFPYLSHFAIVDFPLPTGISGVDDLKNLFQSGILTSLF